ncbi:MAG: hypothetical protein HQK50_18555 [Oligoflexia bacterium]|nr:hypothetical protein [Oligoflexia bacterium]
MGQVLDILQRLGVDQSFYYQLAIIFFMLLACKFLLLDLLLKVIRQREEKTVKLEVDANQKLAKSEQFLKQYDEGIDQTYREIKKMVYEKRREIAFGQKSILKKADEEIKLKIDKERATFSEKIQAMKEQNKGEIKGLMDSFLEKMTK